ncbi:uncharacterized protein AMSG_05034 [Thecamonas trahens ATCC 50062]|uniref:Uncharacterized protein n=1 Tax=Thecamonas trahens ATCC 50062 TaxID=461836 RepID=A0A0L0D9S4_THETB|nr:hypothetical protein AMSG_05034 [Thecamonas trahens ATCC 50062]KNC49074.1 hypothetical protein AMSG_05034 [Thecamonas trahens ATCC 50062]|eukprot:XP_013758105.1 hypothetical protein AMSG_05034 [Thecamonas trahens ATCC 50062]
MPPPLASRKKKKNRFLRKTPENGDFNQYWYSALTIETLVGEAVAHGTRIACLSTPSVFFSLPKEVQARATLFDYDRQWDELDQFVFYDYREPDDFPAKLTNTYDFVVVDPPFITAEVWELYADVINRMVVEGGKIICTTVSENADLLDGLVGVKPVRFKPLIPQLVYQYSIFANYTSPALDSPNPEVPDDSDDDA